jgi:ethanolamine utilization protein EutN
MLRGLVIGKVWATRKRSELEPHALMLVRDLGSPDKKHNVIIAANAMQAKIGEQVILAFGSGARNALGNQDLPIEACIVGIIDAEVED